MENDMRKYRNAHAEHKVNRFRSYLLWYSKKVKVQQLLRAHSSFLREIPYHNCCGLKKKIITL